MVIKKKRLIFLFAFMSVSNGVFSKPTSIDEAFDYECIERKSTLSERRIAKRLARLQKSERTRSALRAFAKGSVGALFLYSGYQLFYGDSQRRSAVQKFLEERLQPADFDHLEQEVKSRANLSAFGTSMPWYDRYWAKLPKFAQGVCQSMIASKLFDLVMRSTGLSFSVMDYLFDDDSLAWCIANKTTFEPVFIRMVKTKLNTELECEKFLNFFPIFIREVEKILAFMRYSESQFHWDHMRKISKLMRKNIYGHIDTMRQQLDVVNELREKFASWDTLTGDQRSKALTQQTSIRADFLASSEDFLKILGDCWSAECAGRKRVSTPSGMRALNTLKREINNARKEILVRFNPDEMPAGVIQN